MKRMLALLLSLAALGLVACGDGDDETTAESATEPTETTTGEFTGGQESCTYDRWTLTVETGEISCSEAQSVIKDVVHNDGYSPAWLCNGPEGDMVCSKRQGPKAVFIARF